MHTKFEVSSSIGSRNTLGELKICNELCEVTTPISGTVCHL